MKSPRQTIIDIVSKNDVKSTMELLYVFGLSEDPPYNDLDFISKALVSLILVSASKAAAKRTLEEEMARTLIVLVAPYVNLFNFIDVLVSGTENYLKNSKYNEDIYNELCGQLKQDSACDDEFIELLGECDIGTFLKLMHFVISEDLPSIHLTFFRPILLYIHYMELMSGDLLFAYMAIFLRETEENSDSIETIFYDIISEYYTKDKRPSTNYACFTLSESQNF